ncbi:MAG: M42 family metallopeptidase [Oscillospiraceae bacterium]|nr:M42 family metallopeptidase [Oscillospiraceae bacterium]
MFDTFKTQSELAKIFAPAGRERALIYRLLEMAKPYADECNIDTLGNLIVRKKGGGRKIMVSAHADSIGLIITHIKDKGFLRFCRIGGLRLDMLLGSSVVFENGIKGTVRREAKAKLDELKDYECFVDIGAGSKEAALKHVNVGDIAVFSAETYTNCGNIVSPYLDDRIGCVILLQTLAMLDNPVNDVYFVFSVQEEVGLRGAKTAAYAIQPDLGLAVDVTGVGDTPEVKAHMACGLGKGAAIKLRDNSIISHPGVVAWLEGAAKSADIPVQREVLPAGGTDAGAIHVSRGGVPSGGISIPTRYIHSLAEMADLADIDACTRLLTAALNTGAEL